MAGALVLVVCVIALTLAAHKPAQAAFPGATGRIAFDAWRGHAEGPDGGGTLDADIYTMNPDGTGQKRLPHGWFDYDPAWSADGTKLAFTNQIAEDGSGGIDTFLMDADGSNAVNLTRGGSGYRHYDPAWFPSGRKIVVSSNRGPVGFNPLRLHTFAFDGSGNVTRIVQLTSSDAAGRYPDVSPDGRKIAFERDWDIYVIGANRPEGPDNPAVRLTHNAELEGAPDWSPDGTKIAFHRFSKDFSNAEIVVMNADGSGKKNITRSPTGETGPAWSPSGRQIAYERPKGGDNEIFRMRADGSNRTQLTFNNRDDGSPDWQPLP